MTILEKNGDATWLPTMESSRCFPCEPIFRELFGDKYCNDFAMGQISDIYDSEGKEAGVFLPYISKKISYVLLMEEENVFSFPFSGCILSAFRYQGFYIVCHIATDIDPEKDCKKIWSNFLSDFKIEEDQTCMFKQFKPRAESLHTYGMITKDGDMCTINVQRQYDNKAPKNSFVPFTQKVQSMYYHFPDCDRVMEVFKITI